jgi:hypothetical protein
VAAILLWIRRGNFGNRRLPLPTRHSRQRSHYFWHSCKRSIPQNGKTRHSAGCTCKPSPGCITTLSHCLESGSLRGQNSTSVFWCSLRVSRASWPLLVYYFTNTSVILTTERQCLNRTSEFQLTDTNRILGATAKNWYKENEVNKYLCTSITRSYLGSRAWVQYSQLLLCKHWTWRSEFHFR